MGDEKATTQAPHVERLWVSLNGLVACDAHGGGYLDAAIARFPRRRRHHTPRDSWESYRAADKERYAPGEVESLTCEHPRCGAHL